MSEKTAIPWCDASWSPWIGCQEVSPGCRSCYARDLMERVGKAKWGNHPRVVTSEANWRKPLAWDRKCRRELRRMKVFCSPVSDIFEDRSELVKPRSKLLTLIEQTPNLIWLVLTKRPENVIRLLDDLGATQDYLHTSEAWQQRVWLGVSVEDQQRAEERIPHLLRVPAKVRWLSVEPLLDWVDPSTLGCGEQFDGEGARYYDALAGRSYWPNGEFGCHGPRIDWLVCGGESGKNHRPCDIEQIRFLVDRCKETRVPCFVKQDSGPRPGMQGRIPDSLWVIKEFPA